MPSTSYYRAIAPSLPTELAIQLEEELSKKPTTEPILDALIRFVCGADCPDTVSEGIRTQWPEKQRAAKKALCSLFPSSLDLKRPRDGDGDKATSDAKRQRLTPSGSDRDASQDGRTTTVENAGQPFFTLHAISVTSPVRKKVDITVHERAVRFINLGNQSVEAHVPLSSLRRAFLLPTRGKTKAHCTVVLISSDTPDRGKSNSSSAQTYPQVIFGIEAIVSSTFATTSYVSGHTPATATVAKGGETLPSLRTFLSHLGIQVLEPTADVFKSACSGYGANAGQGGVPGIEAYRAAKAGSLWFMKEGILWGESKPCEFWAVGDLLGKTEGLRVLAHPGGRTCTITLTRKSTEELSEDEDEDVGMESVFTMIDSRELEGINRWVRAYRHLFGKKKGGGGGDATTSGPAAEAPYRGPVTIHQIGDESDEGDDDFSMDSSDESDEGSSSSSESDQEGQSDEEESGEEENSDEEGEEGEGEGEELRAENHPLMRPGAVPRMSKAARDKVID